MDDLYTPINEMPGDTGESSSASGMIKNPLMKSRYAKNNDIIQKYENSPNKKYITKSMRINKSAKMQKGALDWLSIVRGAAEDAKGALKSTFPSQKFDVEARIKSLYPDYEGKLTEDPYKPQTLNARELAQQKDKAVKDALDAALPIAREAELDGMKRAQNLTDRRSVLESPTFKEAFKILPIEDVRQLKRQLTPHAKIFFGKNPERKLERQMWSLPRGINPEFVQTRFQNWMDEGMPKIYDWGTPGLQPLETQRMRRSVADVVTGKNKEPKTLGQFFQEYYDVAKEHETWTNTVDDAVYSATQIPKTALNIAGKAGIPYAIYEAGKFIGSKNSPQQYAPEPQDNEGWFSSNNKKPKSSSDDDWLDPNYGKPQNYSNKTKKPLANVPGRFKMARQMKKGGSIHKASSPLVRDLLKEMRDKNVYLLLASSDARQRSLGQQLMDDMMRGSGINPKSVTVKELEDFYYNSPVDRVASHYPVKQPRAKGVRNSPDTRAGTPSRARTKKEDPLVNIFGYRVYGPQTPVTASAKQKIGTAASNSMQTASTKFGNTKSKVSDWISQPKNAAVMGALGATAALGGLAYGGYKAKEAYDNMFPSATSASKPSKTEPASSSFKPTATPTPSGYVEPNTRIRNIEATAEAKSKEIRAKAEKEIETKIKPWLVSGLKNALGELSSNYERRNPYVLRDASIERPGAKIWAPTGDPMAKLPNAAMRTLYDAQTKWENLWTQPKRGEPMPKTYNPKIGKRANIRKGKYVDQQGFSNSATAYVNPIKNARFSSMSPEQQGAAVINSVAENTKQSFRNISESAANTSNLLTNLVASALNETVKTANYASRFASGAAGALDQQTQFSNKIVPATKSGVNTTLGVAKIGAQFVALAAKESAKGMPQGSNQLSAQKIKNKIDNIVQTSPNAAKKLYDIGKKVLNKADQLQPGLKRQFINAVDNIAQKISVPTQQELGERLKTIGEKPKSGRYDTSNVVERILKPIRIYGEVLSPTKTREFGPKFDSYVRRDNYYPSTGTAKDSYTTDKSRYLQKPEKQTQSMQYLDILNRGKKSAPPAASPISSYEQGKTQKRMSKNHHVMTFTKRLETAKETKSQESNNKYF